MQNFFSRNALSLPGALFTALLLSASNASVAAGLIQVNYSPFGAIYAEEEDLRFESHAYDNDDIEYDYSAGARILVDIYYLSYRHASAQISNDIPNATVDTYSVGLGCLSKHDLSHSMQRYSLVGLGVGSGEFEFDEEHFNDRELLLEANFEVGLVMQNHLSFGVGVDAQHFGSFGESKSSTISAYFSAGYMF
ncbi:hypothetical protein TDB9533_03424 [Thalassocella blandensis]|nr:hypothetical protein TDB9533_03424 [Thalassocella blandensis]